MTVEEIQRFASKVKRLCDILIDGMEHSTDRTALMSLRDEANAMSSEQTEGLDLILNGIAEVPK